MRREDVRTLLTGGDRRSIADAELVRVRAGRDRRIVADLATLVGDGNPLVAQRALDVLEKLARAEPRRVEPHKRVFIGAAADSDRWEVQLQIVRALPLFRWRPAQRERVLAILRNGVKFPQTFVRAWALDSLAVFAERDPALMRAVRRHLSAFEASASKALQARARQIRVRLSRVAAAALFAAAIPWSLPAQGARVALDTVLLQRLLVAEDARGTGPEGIAPLLDGASNADARIRRVAIRALGRLQRATPATLAPLQRGLADGLTTIRAEAANALTQRVMGLPRNTPAQRAEVQATSDLLLGALASEQDAWVAGVIARSAARLPFAEGTQARAVESAAREMVSRIGGGTEARGLFGRMPTEAVHDVVEGLYSLARARRALGDPSAESRAMLASALRTQQEPRVRRLAMLALQASAMFDTSLVRVAFRDADAQVRRLALPAVGMLPARERAQVVARSLADPVAMVRVDATRAVRAGVESPSCAPLIAATHDRDPHVMLAAIDALAGACSDAAGRTATLVAIANGAGGDVNPEKAGEDDPEPSPVRTDLKNSWHAPARALVALSRSDAIAAARILPRFVSSPNKHAREYAARAAAQLKDATVLRQLAGDVDHNVQDAAIAGLAALEKHAADDVFIVSLASPGYQVVQAAANALAGSTHPAAAPALLDALKRLTAERRENARDPRVAILTRLEDVGHPMDIPQLEPYLADFDSTVAIRAAAVITKWGKAVTAKPVPLPIRAEPLAAFATARNLRLRFTMAPASGGGVFTVALYPDEAPATVARLVRLATAGYFNGLTFHRIATNFVLQGGSPDATEYVGDGPFMRDELGLRSHDRGTLGISTRGRDTGDAQIFINTVDNPRLDHDYTVFGVITAGLSIVDRIVEGDVIARVDVLSTRP